MRRELAAALGVLGPADVAAQNLAFEQAKLLRLCRGMSPRTLGQIRIEVARRARFMAEHAAYASVRADIVDGRWRP